MYQNEDDNPVITPKELIFTIAIAGTIDAKVKADEHAQKIQSASASPPGRPSPTIQTNDLIQELANELHGTRHVYYAYSVLDSLSSSYSMFKYFFDVSLAGTQDDMHHLMLTPAGIVAIILESSFLVGFSFLACHFDGKKEGKKNQAKHVMETPEEMEERKREEQTEANKQYIVEAWGYFRTVLKGLKNAYKGWRSTVIALGLLGITNLVGLILPVGLVLGVVAAGNRYLMRSLTEARKNMKKNNKATLYYLIKLNSLKPEDVQEHLQKHPIQHQTDLERHLGYMGSLIAGFVDGLYLYVGALTLAVLAPQLLIAMASLCAFYSLMCMVTRFYEEWDYQLDLMMTQTKCELALITKQLQTCYAQMQRLEMKEDKTPAELEKLRTLKYTLSDFIDQFEAKRLLLQAQKRPTWGIAVLVGIKNGLYAYGALSSVMFLVATILTLSGVAFPPLAIAIAVSSGLVFIAGFIAHSLVVNHEYHKRKSAEESNDGYQALLDLGKDLKEQPDTTSLLGTAELIGALKIGLVDESTPGSYFQEWFEVFRSFFSGLGKGQKFIDFAGNPLQEQGSDGHYHDTPVMYVLGGLSAMLFACVLALRALARGFGRPPLGGAVELSAAANQAMNSNDVAEDNVRPGPAETLVIGGALQPATRNDPSPSDTPQLSRLGFFEKSPSFKLGRISSDQTLEVRSPPSSSTIRP